MLVQILVPTLLLGLIAVAAVGVAVMARAGSSGPLKLTRARVDQPEPSRHRRVEAPRAEPAAPRHARPLTPR